MRSMSAAVASPSSSSRRASLYFGRTRRSTIRPAWSAETATVRPSPSNRAVAALTTDPEMAADDRGLVHGSFTFGLADYAAMLAVNDPSLDADQGLGFYWDTIDGRHVVGHNGGEIGTSADWYIDPKSEVAVIVLANADPWRLEPMLAIIEAGTTEGTYPDLTRALVVVALGQMTDRRSLRELFRFSRDINYRATVPALDENLCIL